MSSQTMTRFQLPDSFIQPYVGRQPQWGPIGYVTYKRTYARDLETIFPRHQELALAAGLQDTEEFWLTLTRVTEGTFTILRDHCLSLRLPWDEVRAQAMAQEMFVGMWEFRWLPPGRGLWTMGCPIIDKVGASALANCGFRSTQHIDLGFAEPFCAVMDFSMLGVGMGFDVRGTRKVRIQTPVVEGVHVVEDTREGWVELQRRTLNAFVGVGTLPAEVDYSLVRPAGAKIRGFGGVASGPGPLKELHESIKELLYSRVGEPVSVDVIVDIMNMEGRCVVAGNARRSAEISLGEHDDDVFLDLKDRTKHPKAVDSHRWASNNSILAKVGQKYDRVAKRIAANGEPGCVWLENARAYGRMADPPDHRDDRVMGVNPCSEQSLFDRELCVLVETFPFAHADTAEYLRTLKFAYLYAKTVTLLPTHDAPTNAVAMMNRRIGCSATGVVQAMQKFGRRAYLQMCDRGYEYIQELDAEYSEWLCVPRSIKTTSVKPGGTIPLLPGATPGIHHPHSQYYWRVVRFASNSRMLPAIRAAGYRCVPIDPAKEPNTTAVYFPVETPGFERGERDVSMWEQLELAAAMQHHWADNQVSVTIKFDRDKEGQEIARALELYETRLKGVSFLPHDDHGYEHAPYQEMTEQEYKAETARLRPLDLTGTRHEVTDNFCDTDKCELPVRDLVKADAPN